MEETKKSLIKKYALQGLIALLILAVLGWLFGRERAKERASRDRFSSFFAVSNRCRDPIPEERLKDFFQQFEAARQQLRANPDLFNSWMRLGLLKQTLCDYEGARDIWEYASAIRPKNSLSFGNLGNLYTYDLRDPAKAEANYLKAIENEEAFHASLGNVENPPPFDTNYYRGLHELYRYQFPADPANDRAAGVLLRGIAKVPDAVDLKTLLASYYRDIGNIKEAIRWFEEALKQKPDNTAVKAELERLKSLPKQT